LPAWSIITIAFGAASTTSLKRPSPEDSLSGFVIGIALDAGKALTPYIRIKNAPMSILFRIRPGASYNPRSSLKEPQRMGANAMMQRRGLAFSTAVVGQSLRH